LKPLWHNARPNDIFIAGDALSIDYTTILDWAPTNAITQTTLYYLATNLFGCNYMVTKTITVYPAPTASLTYGDIICAGGEANIEISLTGTGSMVR
jgi:hypothetical protein